MQLSEDTHQIQLLVTSLYLHNDFTLLFFNKFNLNTIKN